MKKKTKIWIAIAVVAVCAVLLIVWGSGKKAGAPAEDKPTPSEAVSQPTSPAKEEAGLSASPAKEEATPKQASPTPSGTPVPIPEDVIEDATPAPTDAPTTPSTTEAHEHVPEVVPGVDATCYSTGLTEGSKCSVCGEILVRQEVLPIVDHKYEDGKCVWCGVPETADGDLSSLTGGRIDLPEDDL